MTGELAGTLTERIAIERQAEARDATGGAAGPWSEIAIGWARFSAIAAGPRVAGDAASALPRWRVTMRAGATVAVGDRLVRVGGRLAVVAVTRDPARADRILIEAEELR